MSPFYWQTLPAAALKTNITTTSLTTSSLQRTYKNKSNSRTFYLYCVAISYISLFLKCKFFILFNKKKCFFFILFGFFPTWKYIKTTIRLSTFFILMTLHGLFHTPLLCCTFGLIVVSEEGKSINGRKCTQILEEGGVKKSFMFLKRRRKNL